MSCQSIIGQAVAFCNKLKIRLTGLEKHLDLPPFPINPADLLFGKIRIRTDKGDPVLFVLPVTDADNLCRDLLVLLSDHDVYGEQVFAPAATLLTDAKDLADRKLLPFVFIVNTGALLYHGDRVQPEGFDGNELGRAGEPRVKEDIVSLMPGRLSSLQKLNHHISSLHLCKLPAFRSEGTAIMLHNRANKAALF